MRSSSRDGRDPRGPAAHLKDQRLDDMRDFYCARDVVAVCAVSPRGACFVIVTEFSNISVIKTKERTSVSIYPPPFYCVHGWQGTRRVFWLG